MQLVGSLNPYLNVTHRFTLYMKEFKYVNKGPPQFTSPIVSEYQVSIQSDKKYQLPKVIDPDED